MVLAWTDGNTNEILLDEDVDYPDVDLVLCRECDSGDRYFLIPDQPFTGPTKPQPNLDVGSPTESEE
tara:strand:+ start:2251 stop:2451 length:201 start_codon:yes stop_codon:yes gene_type:complete